MRPRVCAEPGCPDFVERTGTNRCPDHDPGAWSGSTRRATLPTDWDERRQARLQLDNWTCVDCGLHDPTGRLLECDHDGDRHDHRIESLRTRCTDRRHGGNGCHRRRTQQQAAEARRTRNA